MCCKQHNVFKRLLELIKSKVGTFRCFFLAHLWRVTLGPYREHHIPKLRNSAPHIGLAHLWANSDYSVMSQHKSPAHWCDSCRRRKTVEARTRAPEKGQSSRYFVCLFLSLLHLLGFFCPLAEASQEHRPCLTP